MISCDFFGGLGNNLYQLATVYAIHKVYGLDLQIPSRTERGNIHIYGQESNLEFKRLFDNEFNYNDTVVLERYYHPDINPSTTDFTYQEVPIYDNAIYHGYFQSERYFLEVDISKEFILKKKNIEYLKEKYGETLKKKTVSVHCRLGGDRILPHMQHYHKNVSIDYYRRALSLLDNYSPEEYEILVFTDRIQDAKEILSEIQYPLTFVDENQDNVLDFTLMSLCNVNIICNSTYSWWAAYMNQNEDKKVIVPATEWFGPGYAHFKTTDAFPSSWIKL